ncbi:MAG: signal peptidase II [Acidimicrobiia bacterium]
MSSGRAASVSRPVPRWLAPSIVLGVVILDQLTKSWVVASLSDAPLSIIGSDVELHLTRNSGGAFSLFTNATVVLALLAIVLSVVLVRAVQRARDRLTVVALALVLGGALGNLTDRLVRSPGFLRGEVVDYVRVGSFPSFNVADSCITIGAILLIIAAFRESTQTPTSPTEEHPA